MGYGYRDGAQLAELARWGLYADAFVCAVAVALSLAMGGEALLVSDWAGAFALLQIATSLGSLALLLVWFYRANANVRAMGADGLMGSPGLSVAWFFIPVAFLFMPYVVIRDTWKASASPRDWQAGEASPLLGFWWACFLTASLAGTLSFRIWLEGDYDMAGAVPVLDLISNAAAIPAALLGAEMIRRIQRLQVNPAHLSERFS